MGDEANSAAPTNGSDLQHTASNVEKLVKTTVSPQSQLVTVHLSEDNYLMWRLQVETALQGYGLEEYIQETTSVPPMFIADQQNKMISNEQYVNHHRQDRLICSWLLSSINANLLTHVIGCKTTYEIWSTIERVFNSQSAAKVLFYKRQLHNIKKESHNMREYLFKIKSICDALEAANQKVSDSEQIMTILNGLSDEYEAVVVVLTSQRNPPSIEDVHSILLSHEARIDIKKPQESDLSINLAVNHKSKIQNNNRGEQFTQRGGYSNRSRGRGRWNNSNRPKCQICEKVGHTAAKCYFRLNLNYVPGQGQNTQRNENHSANMAHLQPESINQSEIKNSHTENTRSDHIQDEDWYPDSGATNHITNNLNNLNLESKEYKDMNSIHMGNGKSITITHTG